MGEASSHLAPGSIALRLKQRRDVIEYHHESRGVIRVARECGAGTRKHTSPDLAAQHDLLSPLGFPGIEVNLGNIDELL
jgi:hypothetical protein